MITMKRVVSSSPAGPTWLMRLSAFIMPGLVSAIFTNAAAVTSARVATTAPGSGAVMDSIVPMSTSGSASSLASLLVLVVRVRGVPASARLRRVRFADHPPQSRARHPGREVGILQPGPWESHRWRGGGCSSASTTRLISADRTGIQRSSASERPSVAGRAILLRELLQSVLYGRRDNGREKPLIVGVSSSSCSSTSSF